MDSDCRLDHLKACSNFVTTVTVARGTPKTHMHITHRIYNNNIQVII